MIVNTGGLAARYRQSTLASGGNSLGSFVGLADAFRDRACESSDAVRFQTVSQCARASDHTYSSEQKYTHPTFRGKADFLLRLRM